MKVDKAQFEAVIGNLLRTSPMPRSEAKTGQPKVGGTQTVPQPKPITPRTPDGRFTPEFHPKPPQVDRQR